MSECHIFDGWCSVHGGRESCTAPGQVPHLIARAEAAEAEVERLTAERDILRAANAVKAERIDAALALIERHDASMDVIPDLGGIEAALRGEPDE